MKSEEYFPKLVRGITTFNMDKGQIKIDTPKRNGFDVMVVWDSEYRKNPQQTLEKCIKFIIND
jgi:hypothetical protein